MTLAFSRIHRLNRSTIYTLAIIASVVISILALLDNNTINQDAVLYLKAAHYVAMGDFEVAAGIFTEPFYSFLIGGFSKLSFLSVEHAAYVLNTFFSAVLVVAFMRLVECFDTDKTLLVWSAITILIFPSFNEYRSFVIRDLPYAAMYMVMILCFYQYFVTSKLRFAAAWLALVLIGSLLRIESIVFLLLPSCLFFMKGNVKTAQQKIFVYAYSAFLVFIVGFVGLSVIGNLTGWMSMSIPGLGETRELVYSTYLGYWLDGENVTQAEGFLNSLTRINHFSESYGFILLLCTIAIVVAGELFTSLTLPFFLFVSVGLFHFRRFVDQGFQPVFITLIAINGIIVVGFASNLFFLTGRYVLPLSLLLLTIVPPVLKALANNHLSSNLQNRKQWPGYVLIALLFGALLDGVVSPGTSKQYIKDAGLWIQETRAEEDAVYSNDSIATFYSGSWDQRPDRNISYSDSLLDLTNNPGLLEQYRFVALRIRRNEDPATAEFLLKRAPAMEFVNRKGDRVSVFDMAGA